MVKEKVENEKLVSILCYFLIGIIWYFADEGMKKSKFVKFHSKQALNLLIISVGVGIVFSILFFLFWLGWVINLVIFVLWIIGLINAINGKEKEIPIVGVWAEKYLNY